MPALFRAAAYADMLDLASAAVDRARQVEACERDRAERRKRALRLKRTCWSPAREPCRYGFQDGRELRRTC
jgi:hypothetical protein